MRALILVAGASLAISACGGNDTAANITNVDEDLAAQNIAANDTTSIDAATSEDANMAEDVNFTVNETDNFPADDNKADNMSGANAN